MLLDLLLTCYSILIYIIVDLSDFALFIALEAFKFNFSRIVSVIKYNEIAT